MSLDSGGWSYNEDGVAFLKSGRRFICRGSSRNLDGSVTMYESLTIYPLPEVRDSVPSWGRVQVLLEDEEVQRAKAEGYRLVEVSVTLGTIGCSRILEDSYWDSQWGRPPREDGESL